MATKLKFSGSRIHTSSQVEIKNGQAEPKSGNQQQIKTSVVVKENDNGSN